MNLNDSIDIDALLVTAVSKTMGDHKQMLPESYVAQPKQFKQVSEYVSQRTKEAHAAIYKEHVEIVNRISAELDSASTGDSNSNHCNFRSLKLDEVYNLNAVWLHELYFANAFDPHSEIVMDSLAFIELQRAFGSFENWQRNFIACALSCGQGWAVCGYNMFLKNYVNIMLSNNSQDVMLGVYPIIVLDCHDHAYFKDYLTDKKSYIVSQMRELNWNVINDRFNKAKSIAQAVK